MPAGWAAVTDPTHGERYYVLPDGSTTWDLPPHATADGPSAASRAQASELPPSQPPPAVHGSAVHGSAVRGGAGPPPSQLLEDEPLPAGWLSRVDLASGRTFYMNMAEKTTSWSRPERATREQGAGSRATEQGAGRRVGGGETASVEWGAEQYAWQAQAEEAAAAIRQATLAAETSQAATAAELDANETELDAMWSRMKLREPGRQEGGGDGGGDQPAASTAVPVPVPELTPPSSTASRDEIKAYRAEVRKLAASNIRREVAAINAVTEQAKRTHGD